MIHRHNVLLKKGKRLEYNETSLASLLQEGIFERERK